MKKLLNVLLGIFILGNIPLYAKTIEPGCTNQIQVCFTPGGNCTQQIVDAIESAKLSIYVQAYSFTSVPIAKALIHAKEKGIDVKIILDKSQRTQRYSASTLFVNQQIPTWIDTKVAIAHNKVMVVDSKLIITGSFNFTQAAQNKNAENLLMINSPLLAAQYIQNWKKRAEASELLNPNAIKPLKKNTPNDVNALILKSTQTMEKKLIKLLDPKFYGDHKAQLN